MGLRIYYDTIVMLMTMVDTQFFWCTVQLQVLQFVNMLQFVAPIHIPITAVQLSRRSEWEEGGGIKTITITQKFGVAFKHSGAFIIHKSWLEHINSRNHRVTWQLPVSTTVSATMILMWFEVWYREWIIKDYCIIGCTHWNNNYLRLQLEYSPPVRAKVTNTRE